VTAPFGRGVSAGIHVTRFARQCSVMVSLLFSATVSAAIPLIGPVASG
jgi:hypothetical protein